MAEPDPALPGADLVAAGLRDLARGEMTVEALLVSLGSPRLRRLGIAVPPRERLPRDPELALYRALGERHPHDTHARYNALVRRLVSFERALEGSEARRRLGPRRGEPAPRERS
jgi:hypothetical protein